MIQSKAPRSILLVAGETSADRYGAALVRKLRALNSGRELNFFGTGGDEMERAGVELLCHIREPAGIGIRDALRNMHTYLRVFKQLQQLCRERRPAAAVLLDFPDFNLRLAKRLKRLGIKVIYYISPQLWAWRGGRIKTVRRYCGPDAGYFAVRRRVLSCTGCERGFCGTSDSRRIFRSAATERSSSKHLGFDPQIPTIAVLPGSRRGEVEYMLPLFLATARLILRRRPAQFVVSVAPAISPHQVSAIFAKAFNGSGERECFRVAAAPARTILANADFGLIKCGTSTLEAALVGIPFLISYRVARVNWLINNIMIRSRFKGLVNLIAGEGIVPEYLQRKATPEALSCAALEFLEKPEKVAAMKAGLATVRKKLGSRCASECAASLLGGYLE